MNLFGVILLMLLADLLEVMLDLDLPTVGTALLKMFLMTFVRGLWSRFLLGYSFANEE